MSSVAPPWTGIESSLSNWAGPYVTDMMGRGRALANMPYTAYRGPLTAGSSDLQQQGFGGIAGLSVPAGNYEAAANAGRVGGLAEDTNYAPTTFGTNQWYQPLGSNPTQFGAPSNQTGVSALTSPTTTAGGAMPADAYMNPFIEQVLTPQLEEIRRQKEISRVRNAGRMTRAGTFGGGRQAVLESELDDSARRLMNETVGSGYRDAYTTALGAFNQDADRQLRTDQMTEASRQFGAGLDLQGLDLAGRQYRAQGDQGHRNYMMEGDRLDRVMGAGALQRDITQQGIDADRMQFEEERDHPYKQVQYMQSLLQGLPLSTQSYEYAEPSAIDSFTGGASGILALLQAFGLGGQANGA